MRISCEHSVTKTIRLSLSNITNLVLVPLQYLWLLQKRMCLDLVHRWGNGSRLKQLLRLRHGEVADTNAADLSSLDELLKCSPSIRDRDICKTEAHGDWVNREECTVTMLESNGPMDLSRIC
jgi:hypothetical protein